MSTAGQVWIQDVVNVLLEERKLRLGVFGALLSPAESHENEACLCRNISVRYHDGACDGANTASVTGGDGASR